MIERDKNFFQMKPKSVPLSLFILLAAASSVLASGTRQHHHHHHHHSRKLHPEHERQFLEALGLSKVPSLTKSKIEIPEVLREQYYQQTGLDVDTSSFRAPGAHTAYANTVRSFAGRLVSRASGGVEKEAIFDFDFTKDPYDGENRETVQSAILKAYWKPNLSIKRSTGSFKVRIYDLLKMGKLERLEDDSEKSESDDMLQIKMLMDIKKIYHRDAERDEGWYEFDVTPAVQRWIARNPKNSQLILEKGEMKVKGYTSQVLPNGVFEHAMILVYSEDARSQEQRDATRRKRRSSISDAEDMQRKIRQQQRKKPRKRVKGRKFCKRHPLYVDFAEVGWNDWIVAPPGYDANFCHGECPLQLSDHMNTTNHAIVQTLVNSVNPSAVPRSCCVPTELSPISMLYLDEYEKVVLKNYENMVVEGCGCR